MGHELVELASVKAQFSQFLTEQREEEEKVEGGPIAYNADAMEIEGEGLRAAEESGGEDLQK